MIVRSKAYIEALSLVTGIPASSLLIEFIDEDNIKQVDTVLAADVRKSRAKLS